jgi:hypothetical protein
MKVNPDVNLIVIVGMTLVAVVSMGVSSVIVGMTFMVVVMVVVMGVGVSTVIVVVRLVFGHHASPR